MNIEIYKAKNWPTYLVRIGNDVFEMNQNANLPNGVNMYFGDWKECEEYCKGNKLTGEDRIPVGIIEAIAKSLKCIAKEK